MSHAPFSPDWINQFTDPYAVLGISVAADDRRILKRYHLVAKCLHPDAQATNSPEHTKFVSQILPKLVNPAYQRLKQDKTRSEVLATLRFKVRRLSRDSQLKPEHEQSRHLLEVPEADVDVVYEHALGKLSEGQYDSVATFETCTQAIGELNLVYLQRKMGNTIIREKRTGLMGAPTTNPIATTPPSSTTSTATAIPYADRHFQRAHEYLKAKNIPAAIQELKDALKIDPKNSNYHCLMGQAYLLNNLTGMAKVHFKQALRFNPNHGVALKYARQLKIDLTPTPVKDYKNASTSGSPAPTSSQGRLFSRLFSNR
jgi:tetratricopeptide (TPR) repeat protein